VRRTVTLDDDVIRLLAQEMRRSGMSFKQAANHFLRLGLAAHRRQISKKFVVTPRALGLPPGLTYDNVAELLEGLEGRVHK
jgi:hypothetical protein